MVDASKLTRDYSKEPVKCVNKRYEKIPYEDLYEMFINQDMSKPEIMEYTGISFEPLKTQLKNYGIAKSNDDKAKNLKKEDIIEYYINQNHRMEEACEYFNISQTVFSKYCRRYGISKPKSLMYENCKKTNQDLYGVDNQFQLKEIIEKSQKTVQEKYGVEHYAQTSEFMDKQLETRISKYGEEDPFKRNQAKQTIIEKYGVDNINYKDFTLEQLRLIYDKKYLEQYIKENNIKNASELSSKSGLTVGMANRLSNRLDVRYLYDYTGSQYERQIQDIVKQVGLEFITNYKIPNSKLEIDVYIPSLKFGIEFNGDYWHSSRTRDRYYHQHKTWLANNKGIKLYHIFEHDWLKHKEIIIKEILEQLGIKTVYNKEYTIKEISSIEAQKFLSENSIKPYDNDTTNNYGLFVGDDLIHLQSYVVYNKDEVMISHDCNKLNFDYENASKLIFDKVISENKFENVYTIIDVGCKNCDYVEQIGYDDEVELQPWFVWYKHGEIEKPVEKEDIEERYKNGWCQVFDCGRFIYYLTTTHQK